MQEDFFHDTVFLHSLYVKHTTTDESLIDQAVGLCNWGHWLGILVECRLRRIGKLNGKL